jgi:hypothetical protein
MERRSEFEGYLLFCGMSFRFLWFGEGVHKLRGNNGGGEKARRGITR